MSDTFEFEAEGRSFTVGRYASRADDKTGSRLRYTIVDYYGAVAKDLTRADLAKLAAWIVEELATPHEED